ncbi:activator-dependent family glycosyltransferase [Nonomuraea sp. MCN248]|uniref:Activator-dependent family glycosyltransferase n=1 Tax=Nonomuraea corallina TaxID=2989783 RepID=A0ABT4S6E4_9ACTN|nr:activator-dependent family glycosyltransferase [Nonomuraea corallina]MDA0632764.1 activator-dependent family glycosyltransferase [Nonomuraea corallina]
MRVLFTTFAAPSHFYAQVTVASALRTAGHEVIVASQPELADTITAAGLTAVPVGPVLDLEPETQQATSSFAGDRNLGGLAMSNSRHDPYPWERALGMFSAMTAFVFQNVCSEQMIDDLVEVARDWRPDLVIWDPLTLAGPVAARVTGAAHARLLFGPDQMARNRTAFRALLDERPAELRDDPLTEWLGWTLARHGERLRERDEELVLGQWTIDPTPPSMRAPVGLPYVNVRYVPYNGRSALPGWLRETPPYPRRVCLTLGISLGEVEDGGTVAAGDLMAAVDGLDVEVVAALAPELRNRLGTLPGNVRAVDFVPLDALLPSCAGIIHHGGSGTFMTALARGVPQLIVPDLMWDSKEKTLALTAAGAGLVIEDQEKLSPDHLRERIITLLDDPAYAAGAARLRAEMVATPAPNDIVPVLERLTALNRA